MVEAEPPEAWTSVREGEADVALVFGYDGPPPDDGELVWVPLAAYTRMRSRWTARV